MRRLIGSIIFAALLTWLCVGNPWTTLKALAAADPGYTKIGSVPAATPSFTDSTVVNGQTYQYEETAANAAGESVAGPVTSATIPATGSHTTTTTWTPGTGGSPATTFNIYRLTVTVPNPPVAPSTVVN